MLLDRSVSDDGDEPGRIAIHAVSSDRLADLFSTLPPGASAYAKACGFDAEEGRCLLVPSDRGLAFVLFGTGKPDGRRQDPFLPGRLVDLLPEGEYRLSDGFDRPDMAALAFELGSYRFTRFKAGKRQLPKLEMPDGIDGERIAMVAGAIAFGRDLINRPANDLGPAALEAEIVGLADRYGAQTRVTRGAELLAADLPLIHAVGRAAAEAPRLVDFTWGRECAPMVTLVGKGVCFDTGGLDIKPSSAMLLMKKDMGGAAAALALAAMVMEADIPVRLRVMIPIVENAIAGDAFRPGDVLRSRKGLSVEVGNTDAEGRLILADALSLADEETPDLLVDFATLTGAARVALGPDLPALYTADDALADAIIAKGRAVNDPCWRLPLWDPYDSMLKSNVADLNNAPGGSFAGSITAALFLRRFVANARNWAHFDVYGWTPKAKPGRPEGGEVQMAHALFELLSERYRA